MALCRFLSTRLQTCQKYLGNDFILINDFINNNEEDNLINEINFIFRKTIYQSNHWDDAIIDYRETERPNFRQDANNDIVCQMKKKIEKNIKRVINFNEFFHIIDISKSGFIKPHVDSIRFCGQVISVLSLCSDSILRLRNTKDQSDYNDFMLKRKSLYILKGKARYNYTHEILKDGLTSKDKNRRLSIVLREQIGN